MADERSFSQKFGADFTSVDKIEQVVRVLRALRDEGVTSDIKIKTNQGAIVSLYIDRKIF